MTTHSYPLYFGLFVAFGLALALFIGSVMYHQEKDEEEERRGDSSFLRE